MKLLVLDELNSEEERGEEWGVKRLEKPREEVRRFRRSESSEEQDEDKKRRKRRSGSLDELEEEGEDEDLEEGYSEDKEVLKEVLNLKFSNLNKKKFHGEATKNEAGMSSTASRKDVYHSRIDSDTDDEDHVELVFVRRTNTGAWGRAAGGIITSSSSGHNKPNRSTFGSRSSVGSNIGGIGSTSRSSLSHRGSISETVAAITAHRGSLSSSSLLSSRTSSSRPATCRTSNVSSSGPRPNSTTSTGTNRAQNRRGSGLSICSLGISSNVASTTNAPYSGGFSLDSSDEYKTALSCDKDTSGVLPSNERRKSVIRATYISSGHDRSNRAGTVSEDDKYEDESCDGAVAHLLDRGVTVRPEETTRVHVIGANMMKCASWVGTKVSIGLGRVIIIYNLLTCN